MSMSYIDTYVVEQKQKMSSYIKFADIRFN